MNEQLCRNYISERGRWAVVAFSEEFGVYRVTDWACCIGGCKLPEARAEISVETRSVLSPNVTLRFLQAQAPTCSP